MVAESAIGWTVRFPVQPAIEMRTNSVTEVLTLATDPTINYYPYKLVGSDGLLAVLVTALETHSQAGTFTASLQDHSVDGINARVRIVHSTTSFQLRWAEATTTLNANICGFAVSNGGFSTTQNGTALVGGLWHPRRPISFDAREQRPVVGGLTRSLSGLVRVSNFGQPFKERRITVERFQNIFALEEAAQSGEPINTFEYLWQNSLALGNPFEIFEDRDDFGTGSGFAEYRITDETDPMSRDGRYPMLWNVSIRAARTS